MSSGSSIFVLSFVGGLLFSGLMLGSGGSYSGSFVGGTGQGTIGLCMVRLGRGGGNILGSVLFFGGDGTSGPSVMFCGLFHILKNFLAVVVVDIDWRYDHVVAHMRKESRHVSSCSFMYSVSSQGISLVGSSSFSQNILSDWQKGAG